MASADILIRWASDSSAAIRDMRRVERGLGQTMSRTEKWSNRLDKVSTVAAGALLAMVPAAYRTITAASDQEQAYGALTAVFRDYADEMKRAAEEANKLGLSQTEYAQFAARLGGQLRNLGYSTRDAVGQTQQLIDMGADMAAQYGGTTADAVEALGSALRGEYEMIERYAMGLKQNEVNAYAAEKGISKTQAAIEMLGGQLKKTGTLGASAREFDTFAASTQRLKGAWEDFLAAVGKSGKGKGTVSAIELITQNLRKLTKWIDENPDTFNQITKGIVGITAVFAVLKPAMSIVGLIGRVAGALGGLLKIVKGIPSPITALIAWAAFEEMLDRWTTKRGGWYRAVSWLKDIADFLSNPVGNSMEIAIKGIAEALERVKSVWDTVKGLWSAIGSAIGGKLEAPVVTSSSTFTPAARTVPAVNVFVAGEQRRATVRTEPAWAPHLTLGVV